MGMKQEFDLMQLLSKARKVWANVRGPAGVGRGEYDEHAADLAEFVISEAADTASLRAENAKLREALELGAEMRLRQLAYAAYEHPRLESERAFDEVLKDLAVQAAERVREALDSTATSEAPAEEK